MRCALNQMEMERKQRNKKRESQMECKFWYLAYHFEHLANNAYLRISVDAHPFLCNSSFYETLTDSCGFLNSNLWVENFSLSIVNSVFRF